MAKPSTSQESRRDQKWYRAGLAFNCQRSGHCCSGEPGYVWVTKSEIQAIARFLDRTDGRLGKEFLRRVGFRHSLTEKQSGDCVFLERGDGETQCRINPVKPNQCRTWPFWKGNLHSPDHWNHAAKICPGINRGETVSFEHIEELRTQKAPR